MRKKIEEMKKHDAGYNQLTKGHHDNISKRASIVAQTFVSVAEALVARENLNQVNCNKFQIGLVAYSGFEVWDAFGLLDSLSSLRERVKINIIAQKRGVIESSAGVIFMVDYCFKDAPHLDMLIVPGMDDKNKEVMDVSVFPEFRELAIATPTVVAISKGAAFLAKTGLLDGLRVAIHPESYERASYENPDVRWETKEKWVEDGKYFTSVLCGGRDLSQTLIDKLYGQEKLRL